MYGNIYMRDSVFLNIISSSKQYFNNIIIKKKKGVIQSLN